MQPSRRRDVRARSEGEVILRIAAIADVHARVGDTEILRALAGSAAQDADVLVIGGDLTDLGHLEQAEVLLQALGDCPVPVVVTLGNHDYESGNAAEISCLLAESKVHLLDRSSVVLDGVGFAGVKGFCGGFDHTIANSFGEDLFKAWVTEGILEAEALKTELRGLETGRRVAVLHYAPIRATVEGELPEIHAFLGTSRLGTALDEGYATVAFHGHAHNGPFKGKTPGGVPVFNVSLPVLEQEGFGLPYYVVEI
jgi:Icc-related predicted phosphoesterase